MNKRTEVKKSPEFCKRYCQFRFGPVAAKIFMTSLNAWVQIMRS